jgi:hypothetical protein
LLPPLILRLIMVGSSGSPGVKSIPEQNWFADNQARFPFPFNQDSGRHQLGHGDLF